MIYKEASNLGKKLKQLRLQNNLLQKQIADYLKIAKSTYSQYETGKTRPDYETLKKIATLYNISLDELLGHEIISENEEEFLYHKLKHLTKVEINDKAIIFYDKQKLTNEELNILEAIFNAIKK